MCEDPLVYIPVEKWESIKVAFQNDWPRSISSYTILETQQHIFKLGLDYGFKVYCPYGDILNGMVALNFKDTLYEVVIQSPNDDTDKLFKALMTTKLIDWKRPVHVPFAPKHVMNCVRQVIQDMNMKVDHLTMTETFVLDKDRCLFEDIRLPEDFIFKHLTLNYVELVNSTWPHRYENSSWYFELLTRANLGYGLFKGSELIAWVFIKEMGALGHLYTLEEHRRKGYGEMILKLISNVLLKQGQYVVAFCVEGNESAYKLYKKLGFERTDELEWCTFTKL